MNHSKLANKYLTGLTGIEIGGAAPQPNNSDKEFTTQNHFYNQPHNQKP
jgi:hypothetical protein